MARVLITAFEAYDRWEENSSWLALAELARDPPRHVEVTSRRYPVNFRGVRERLAEDLQANYDFALHLGQSPGSARIALEAIAVNVGGELQHAPHEHGPLSDDGPVAYRSRLPLTQWAARLAEAEIPADVSYHAGTYVCNATMYWSHYLIEQIALPTRAGLVHLPLAPVQASDAEGETASLPVATSAQALRMLLEELAGDGAR